MIQTAPRSARKRRALHKEPVIGGLASPDRSALAKYQDFFVGRRGLRPLLRFELVTALAANRAGAAGFLLRKRLFPLLFGSVGRGVQFGRALSLRCPGRVLIGDRSAIDDGCLLDARGGGGEPGAEGGESWGIRIGNDVLIARDTIIQCKPGIILIGDACSIGSQCILSSTGGIRIGRHVLVGGQCYIGGGRYGTELTGTPMMHQEMYTQGPVVIGNDVWLGAGVTVLDGVTIGSGSVIGAGAVVRRDVPENTILVPEDAFTTRPRAIQPAMARVFARLRDDDNGHEESGT